MSIPLNVNGVVYDYPETDDQDWGPDATDWASAVTTGMLQKAGGLFQLLAEADFGSAFGLKALYYKSRTANPADAGQIRFARADVLNWRNQANSANLSLGVSASDVLQFNGVDIQSSLSVSDTATIDLTLSSNVLSAAIVSGSITNAMINAAAAIAYSKLNLAASIANSDLVVMAESTIKGRAASAGTGAPVDLTATQATAILNAFVGDSGAGGTKGLVPAPAAGDAAAQKFLFSDGTWATPPGAGDVVGPASSTDSGFARFDGLTGKLLKDSAATIANADVAAAAAIAVNKLAALTASRAVVSDGSGFLTVATTTAAEVEFVNGVTSAIQTQIDSKTSNPMTTGGDVIYGGASGVPTRLANGSEGQFLASTGGTSAPVWSDQLTVQTKTANYTTVVSDGVVLVDATSGAITITLIAASAAIKPVRVIKTDSSTNLVTISRGGADTFVTGGTSNVLHRQGEAVEYTSDKVSEWFYDQNMRTEWAYLSGGASPVVTSQSGSWLSSITYNATGRYTLNIRSGIFSATPYPVGITNTNGNAVIWGEDNASTTTFTLQAVNSNTGAGATAKLNIIVSGYR